MKITKKVCKSKLEINTEDYLIRKNMEGEYGSNLFKKSQNMKPNIVEKRKFHYDFFFCII